MLAMPKHHDVDPPFSAFVGYFVLCYIRMSFKGDPLSRLEERARDREEREKKQFLYEASNSTDLLLEL